MNADIALLEAALSGKNKFIFRSNIGREIAKCMK